MKKKKAHRNRYRNFNLTRSIRFLTLSIRFWNRFSIPNPSQKHLRYTNADATFVQRIVNVLPIVQMHVHKCLKCVCVTHQLTLTPSTDAPERYQPNATHGYRQWHQQHAQRDGACEAHTHTHTHTTLISKHRGNSLTFTLTRMLGVYEASEVLKTDHIFHDGNKCDWRTKSERQKKDACRGKESFR